MVNPSAGRMLETTDMNSSLNHIVLAKCRALLPLLLLAFVPRLAAQTFTYDADGLYYSCDPGTKEAVLIACRDANTGYVYEQANVFVPATITVSGASMGGDSSSESENTYTVTEIGEGALEGAWAQTLAFGKGSQVRIIRRRGLYGLGIKTLELPASLRVIEEEGLYIRSSQKTQSFIATLVLPASLDSLGLSSIVLNRLQKLRFLGMTPPKCAVAEGDARNPWTAADNATPEDITVEYPEGCRDLYKERVGIGDYFTAFAEPETPTGVEETDAETRSSAGAARKVMQGGRVTIIRGNRTYNLFGQGL
ncbi:MAG: hypothetical protein J6Y00_08300 [Paludibacteraceae bacterium]|nr:hypothetical protein [Paludibacteraceae bacterium]